jgi:hypothetical protein
VPAVRPLVGVHFAIAKARLCQPAAPLYDALIWKPDVFAL